MKEPLFLKRKSNKCQATHAEKRSTSYRSFFAFFVEVNPESVVVQAVVHCLPKLKKTVSPQQSDQMCCAH